jgi:hypothetical protein
VACGAVRADERGVLTTTNLKIMLTGAIAALAVAAPVAGAKPAATDFTVCNQATPHSLGGDLLATDGDPTPPARYKENLERHPGNGVGLVNAAGNSPALSLCNDTYGGDDYDDHAAS